MSAKTTKSYQPAESEKYMNAKQLDYFRQKLLTWREELLAESRETINNLKEENWREPDLSDRASLETEAGVELRTRFYEGYVKKGAVFVREGGAAPLSITAGLNRHMIKEFTNLASFLPALYAEQGPKPDGASR